MTGRLNVMVDALITDDVDECAGLLKGTEGHRPGTVSSAPGCPEAATQRSVR